MDSVNLNRDNLDFDLDEQIYEIEMEDENKRLDVFLTSKNQDLSRSVIQGLISKEQVVVNGVKQKANYKLKIKDEIKITLPTEKSLEVRPEEYPLDILYEDEDIIIVNKEKGMVVHPAPGNLEGTLVNALLFHSKNLSRVNGELRPGIVHRIDKDTSGVLVIAKNDEAHSFLAKQIKDHSMSRVYLALVHGRLEHSFGTIDAPIGRALKDRKKMEVTFQNSKEAITHFKVLDLFEDYSFLELKLETGRTHQIRVHMADIGHPVVGDPKYGPRKSHFNLNGQALHAATLGFIHPKTREYVEFTSPLPAYFELILQELRANHS